MHTQHYSESPQHARGGQISYLLLTQGQFGSRNLSITWVECEPGSEQEIHAHPHEEQVYVITHGRGMMRVGREEQVVEAGTMVFTPPGLPHAIRNTGSEKLIYVSATAPPFDPADLYASARAAG